MCFKLKDMNIHSLQDIETELLAKNTALTFLHVACCQDERCCKDERIFSINYILTISGYSFSKCIINLHINHIRRSQILFSTS